MIECDARVLINDELITNAVSAGIDPDGNYLYVNAGPRNKLFVHPFTAQMISRWDSSHMKTGIDYGLSGTDVGFWTYGPIGHPGDGEFENRHFTSVRIHIGYSPAKIVVTLSGNTEEGSVSYKAQPDPANTSLLPMWKFEVEFSVSRKALKEFLPMKEVYYSSLRSA